MTITDQSVVCTWEEWSEHGDSILAIQQVTEVRLTTPHQAEYILRDGRIPAWVYNIAGRRVEVRDHDFARSIQITEADLLVLEVRWPDINFIRHDGQDNYTNSMRRVQERIEANRKELEGKT